MESHIITTENNKRILHTEDVITHEELQQLLENQEFDYIFNDIMSELNYPGQDVYMLPLLVAYLATFLINKKIIMAPFLKPCDVANTKTAFNFMVNKKQVNRYLCIKLVELFELTSFDYTWSGVDQNFDMSTILEELDTLGTSSPMTRDERTFLLSPITTQPKILSVIQGTTSTNSYIKNSVGPWGVWIGGLKSIFERSAVSLITESISYDPAMVFTEKTVYATIGLTFPIWVGGYRQAQNWKKLGFDTFDDVIDHSYQHHNTVIERCYYAIKNNLKILQDVEYASQLRSTHMERLKANDALLRSDHLERFCRDIFKTWPQELQHAINDIVESKLAPGLD